MMDQSFLALARPRRPVAVERDLKIPVDCGEITLRFYSTDPQAKNQPCHIYYHGGGFFLGTLDQADGGCRALAVAAGCAVVSVEYRLAPEHRFPTAAEDAYAALCWVASHAGELGIDAGRISVGGGSAGGNLAAVVTQMGRDRDGPRPVAQVLEIPVTDFTSTATLAFPDEDIHIGSTKSYAALYLRDDADAESPLASPLRAASLADLAPALVMVAEYDQLQPEGEAYAKRLAASGVPTTYHCWRGQFHGSQFFDAIIPDEAAAYLAEIVGFLRQAYAR
jgi:acetyl esterase